MKKTSNSTQDKTTKEMQLRNLLLILCVILFLFAMWFRPEKKELIKKEEMNHIFFVSEKETFEIKKINGMTKFYEFNILNERDTDEQINIGIQNLKNQKNNEMALKYSLYLGETQEVYNENFPKEEINLIEGVRLAKKSTLKVRIEVSSEMQDLQMEQPITWNFKISEEIR